MSTYKKNNEHIDIGGFSNCPDFLERYLTYRETFTNMKVGSVVDIFTVLREFCQYVHFKKRLQIEPSTKDAHKDMDVCLMDVQEVCDVSQEDLERYLCFLEMKVKNSSKTIRKKILFLKKFYLYLERNAEELGISLPHGNPARFLDLPQVQVQNPVTLSAKDIERLLNGTTGENAIRDKAFIMVLATTGIQTTELINLDRGDVLEDSLYIQSPKGSRSVILTAPCKELLAKYLRLTREFDRPDHPLFLSAATGKRLTARSIQLRIEKAAAIAGMADKDITARVLRNTAAAMLFQSCSEEEQAGVRKYLGCRSNSSMRSIINSCTGSINADTLNTSGLSQIGRSDGR